MSKPSTLNRAEVEHLDQFYREGGLRVMASPHAPYDDPACPHADCDQKMEWIDFKLELLGDPEEVFKPLVRSWWEGSGFVGHCPSCGGWVRFTTLPMTALDDDEAQAFPHLPPHWVTIAQFA